MIGTTPYDSYFKRWTVDFQDICLHSETLVVMMVGIDVQEVLYKKCVFDPVGYILVFLERILREREREKEKPYFWVLLIQEVMVLLLLLLLLF